MNPTDKPSNDQADSWATAEPEPAAVVKVRSPADVVGVVPYQLGFHPAESIVLLCLHGPRQRIRFTVRHDLVGPDEEAELTTYLAQTVARDGADDVIAVVYTEAGDEAPAVGEAGAVGAAGAVGEGEAPGAATVLPRRAFVDALSQAFAETLGEPGLLDAFLVRGGKWWSYLCQEPTCCPPSGTPIPEQPDGAVARMAAESALAGQAVLPGREALEASILPPEGKVAEAAREQMLTAADLALAARYLEHGAEACRTEAIEHIEVLARRWLDGDHTLDPADAACAVVSMGDKAVRDRAAAVALDVPVETYLALLVQLCRSADPATAAPVATVLAWVAYMNGDGALANVALDRALACDPGYTMAELLLTCLQGQVPPAEIRRLTLQGSLRGRGDRGDRRGRGGRRGRRGNAA